MNVKFYLILFLVLLCAKSFLVLILRQTGIDFFGGGNDSYYYDEFARGYVDHAVNSWPIILRALNELSLYSREGVSYALILLAFIVIPLCVGSLCKVHMSPLKHRAYWASAFLVAAYPTIIYYAMDIYREVFMIFVWLCGLFIYKGLSENPCFSKRMTLLLLGLIFSWFLYTLRPYLGFAYLVSLLFAAFYSFRRVPPSVSLVFLAGILLALYSVGLLEPILNYRDIFDAMEGGSTLGIEFASSATFLPDLVRSTASQLFGLHFPNKAAIAVFLLETIPFVILLTYVIKNRAYSTKFVDFLVLFFVAYASIWLLGNDNLGTAVRLRIFNYLAILIAFFIIYQNKKLSFSVANQTNKKLRFRFLPVTMATQQSQP